ncbi:hypothetical protein LX64_00853 [Chitinophaga skermanii]|uniref:Uncharacterized protein n=1 Tax=Chitinophaga skermanii TaxID=331697 RepID=A0A327QU67_9BACT|nr:hypothetical protein LX64_00853 [Chitinophaga skermanii]
MLGKTLNRTQLRSIAGGTHFDAFACNKSVRNCAAFCPQTCSCDQMTDLDFYCGYIL